MYFTGQPNQFNWHIQMLLCVRYCPSWLRLPYTFYCVSCFVSYVYVLSLNNFVVVSILVLSIKML
jgi:hypothetical protein